MKNNLSALLQIYKNTDILSLVYGSNNPQETDICIIQPDTGLGLNFDKITQTAESLATQLKNSQLENRILIYDLHKQFVLQDNLPIIHLIFFPSLEYLYYWELPSYLFYIFKSGRWITGNNEKIAVFSNIYRKDTVLSFPKKEFHLAQYAKIATNYYLYSIFRECSIINFNEAYSKISYAYRYTLNELINLKTNTILIYDWEEIFKFNYNEYDPSVLSTLNKICAVKNSNELLQLSDIKVLFESFCVLYNSCLKFK